MSPILSMNNAIDERVRNKKPFGDDPSHAWFEIIANPLNVFESEFGAAIPLSKLESSFLHGIMKILFCSPSPQMIWTNTWGIVARMKYFQTSWNRSVMDNPRNSMGGSGAKSNELSVPAFKFRALPQPTAFRFLNKSPKFISFCFYGIARSMTFRFVIKNCFSAIEAVIGRLCGHRKYTPFGVTPPATTIARGLFCIE